MKPTIWTHDVESLNEFSNQVKEVLLHELERQGYLRIPALKINEEIAVIVHRPSWFGSMIRRWFGEDDGYKISIIKMLCIAEPDKKKNLGSVISLVNKKDEQ